MFSRQLDTGEKTIVVIRKHWFMFALQAFLLSLLAIAPVLAVPFIPKEAGEALATLGVSEQFLLLMYVLFLLGIWVLGFISWTVYYLDTWIVTNRRVIDVNQKALFVREITNLMLEKVQDVTVEVNGILPTLFGFGTLTLHTAGENTDIVIRFAAHPQYARDRIMECQRFASQNERRDTV